MLALLLAVAHHAYDPNPLAHFWYWVEIHTGAINEQNAYYGWWSGAGSDLGEIALIGGIFTLARSHNCHVKHCWRINKHPVEGTPYKVCRKHHPTIPSNGKITAEHISDAHASAKISAGK